MANKVRNYTMSCVQHLKTCITLLRAFRFLKGCIWVFLECLFIFFQSFVLRTEDEEVNHWLEVSQTSEITMCLAPSITCHLHKV